MTNVCTVYNRLFKFNEKINNVDRLCIHLRNLGCNFLFSHVYRLSLPCKIIGIFLHTFNVNEDTIMQFLTDLF